MDVTTFMTMLWLSARNTRLARLRYWPGLRTRPNQEAIPQARERNHPVDRAAWERIGRRPFSDTSGMLGNTNRSEKGYF
jgi:hypothetical protein